MNNSFILLQFPIRALIKFSEIDHYDLNSFQYGFSNCLTFRSLISNKQCNFWTTSVHKLITTNIKLSGISKNIINFH